MNDKLTTETYHYRLNQLHRDDVMRAADQERLAQLASDEPKAHPHLVVGLLRSVQQFFDRHHLNMGGHKTRKTLRHSPSAILAAIIVSGVLLARALPSRAQSIPDPGAPDPNAELVYYGVGMYFQVRGNHEQAIQEFTLTIEALPLEGDVYAARADSFVALEQYAAAIDDYTRALELNGDDRLTLVKRAFTFAALGDLHAAQQDFEHMILIGSESPL
jgi:tetratricopeptide (TPR) repeat protein